MPVVVVASVALIILALLFGGPAGSQEVPVPQPRPEMPPPPPPQDEDEEDCLDRIEVLPAPEGELDA